MDGRELKGQHKIQKKRVFVSSPARQELKGSFLLIMYNSKDVRSKYILPASENELAAYSLNDQF